MTRRTLAALAAVALLAAAAASTTRASNSLFPGKAGLKVTRIGSLPRALSKAAAVALPGERLMVLGGYADGRSLGTILAGPPSRLRIVGHLPHGTYGAAAVAVRGRVYLFGGNESVAMPSVVRVNPRTGAAAEAPALDQPVSDIGAAAIGGRAYVVGGYTGTVFVLGIVRYVPQGGTELIGHLPVGTRYAGVTAAGGTIYVAGGLTPAGPTRAIYAFSVTTGRPRRIGTLPMPEDRAALVALAGRLYLVGGRRVLAIDPHSGRVSVAARLPVALADPTATRVGRRIIVTGGGTDGVWALVPRT